MTATALFSLGDVVEHKRFGYRGVIYDVDPQFALSEEWYEQVAKSRPPKDEPWYRILVHEGMQETYVAECNLEADDSGDPVIHPLTVAYLGEFRDGHYTAKTQSN